MQKIIKTVIIFNEKFDAGVPRISSANPSQKAQI